MDLFELLATLGIDTNPFISGITGALSFALDALVDFGKDVLKTGMGFDKEMSAVQAVLGSVEGTEENMIRLRAYALEQARDSIFTAEQTAEAYYYMGMAGWKTQEMLDGLPGIMALAAASGEDLGMVSDIVTDSLTAFGWEAGRAAEFADILAQAATNSNTDVKRMGETFKYIAPIAGSLGVEVEDVALSIGLLASQGIKGSMAGTALRNILVRLSTNAGETKKDLGALTILTEKLGVQFWDSSGKMRDFGDIIKESRVAWKGLTQEEQTYYAKQIGSQRGMAAWMALMNASTQDVEQLEYAFSNAEGAAQNMADVKLDNLWGDIQMFNSSLDVLKVALFDDVKSPLRDVVQYGTSALDRIRDAILEDGLIGGIRQLGTELRDFGEAYKDEFKALGEAIMPVLHEFINTITPAFVEMAGTLGSSFGAGLFEGLKGSVSDNWLSLLFGDAGPGLGLPGAYEQKHGGLFGSGISEKISADAAKLKEELAADIGTGDGITPNTIPLPKVEPILDTDAMEQQFAEAGTDGGDQLLANLPSPDEMIGMYPEIFANSIAEAGSDGGARAADQIQTALDSKAYYIDVIPNLIGIAGTIAGFVAEKHAKSMSGGTILQGATVFGMNNQGQPMVGGEAGPEAIVGTGSLNRMIQSSVNGAMNGVLSRLDTMVSHVANYAPKIYLDTGALVGGTVNGMNSELNNVARWKGYGRV